MPLRNTIDVEFHSRATAAVVLHGEHDLYTSDQLSISLELAGECPFILVDVHEATFLDTSVIRAIMRAARIARERDGALELVVSPTGAVRRALELAGIREILPIHQSRGVALASLETAGRLEPHRKPPRTNLSLVVAKIEHFEAKAEARRNAQHASIAFRAEVTDAEARQPRRAA